MSPNVERTSEEKYYQSNYVTEVIVNLDSENP